MLLYLHQCESFFYTILLAQWKTLQKVLTSTSRKRFGNRLEDRQTITIYTLIKKFLQLYRKLGGNTPCGVWLKTWFFKKNRHATINPPFFLFLWAAYAFWLSRYRMYSTECQAAEREREREKSVLFYYFFTFHIIVSMLVLKRTFIMPLLPQIFLYQSYFLASAK